jgi:hypothetical protein
MAGKLSRRSQQRIKRITEVVDSINKMANRLNLKDFEELVRRDDIEVTSFNSGGGPGFAASRRGSKSSSSSVERNVIAALEGRKVYDPVREQVKKIERRLIEAEENLRIILESVSAMKENVEKKRKRQTTEPCEICTILPSAKTAMCIPCYLDWVDAGAPDRFRWKAYKRQMLSSDGIPLVSEQPPALRRKINT